MPSIGASGAATHERTSTGSGQLKTFTSFAPGLNASYELDFWGKNRAAAEAAVDTATASRFDQATVDLTIVTSVANSYFQALEFRDRLAVAQDNLTSAETILKGAAAAGTDRRRQCARRRPAADHRVDALRRHPAAAPAARQNLDALAILIGQPAESVDLTDGTLSDLAVPSVAPRLPSELLARRPDVAEAEGSAAIGQRQYHGRSRGLLSQHPADQHGRLRQHRARLGLQPGERPVFDRRRG
ncbi:MAG: TolC family protein [Aliidongia sp.]